MQEPWGNAVARMVLAYVAVRKDDRATALTLAQDALMAFHNLGDQYFQSVCLYESGATRVKLGDLQEGLAELREALRLSHELGSKFEIATGLLRLAEAQHYVEQPAHAVKLYCASKNVYDSIGALQQRDESRFAEGLARCRDSLEESIFPTALEEGRAMTMEQAIAYALEDSR